MFGTHARVIEPGGDGVGLDDLAVPVLHKISAVAVQDPRHSRTQRSRMMSGIQAFAGGLYSIQGHLPIS